MILTQNRDSTVMGCMGCEGIGITSEQYQGEPMNDVRELRQTSKYRATMEQLQALKRVTVTGKDYWLAREIYRILGYRTWEGFEGLLARAMAACDGVGAHPDNHFQQTSKMVEIGSGAKRPQVDYFMSRIACYLTAMNGESSMPEVAAAQAYFAVQTRRMELYDQQAEDERRLEMRERVSTSFKRVRDAAHDAGVRNMMQLVFQDARYQGLYGMSAQDVKLRKGLNDDDTLFDYAKAMELSANDFQMNLAADVITRDHVKGEQQALPIRFTPTPTGVRMGANPDTGERAMDVLDRADLPFPHSLPEFPATFPR